MHQPQSNEPRHGSERTALPGGSQPLPARSSVPGALRSRPGTALIRGGSPGARAPSRRVGHAAGAAGAAGAAPPVANGYAAVEAAGSRVRCICGSNGNRGAMVQCEVRPWSHEARGRS